MPNNYDVHKHPAHQAMSRKVLHAHRAEAQGKRTIAVEPMDLFKAVVKGDVATSALVSRYALLPLTFGLDKLLGTHGNPYVQLHQGPTWAGASDDHGFEQEQHAATGAMDFVLMAVAAVQPLNYPAVLIAQGLCVTGAGVKGSGSAVGAALGTPLALVHGGYLAVQRHGRLKLGEALVQWTIEAMSNNATGANDGRSRAAKLLGIKPIQLEQQRFLISPSFSALNNARILHAANSSKHSTEMFAALGQMNFSDILPEDQIRVIKSMAKMGAEDVTAFARAVNQFGAMDGNTRLDNYTHIINTPVDGRQGHANRLNHGFDMGDVENIPLQLQDNRENVMEPRRRVRVAKAIDYLLDSNFKKISNDRTLDRINKAIKDRKLFPGMHDDRTLVYERVVDGRREITGTETVKRWQNVERVLYGTKLTDDYTLSLDTNEAYAYRRIPNVNMTQASKTINLLDLASVVLSAIDSYNSPKGPAQTKIDQHEMMKALLFWISEMIDDDGHRVCHIGISQRLPMCLQNYYPIYIDVTEPEQLSTEMCREWAGELADQPEDPPQTDINAFALRALSHAHDVYSFEPTLLEPFEAALFGYLKETFSKETAEAARQATPSSAITLFRQERDLILRGIKKVVTSASIAPSTKDAEPAQPVAAEASSAAQA